MALKSKITKAEYDALHDILKPEYKEKDGNYLLDSDEANELRVAKDRETEARRQEKERADRLEAEKQAAIDEANEAKREKAKKDKDVETLETSWQEKLNSAVAGEKAKTEKREEQLRRLLVDNEAISLANEISVSPKLILPHIRARLSAELEGDTPITRILDADGKPSAKTIADLKSEFIDNEDFKAIIKGSNANGGGANGGGSGGGAGSKKFAEMSEAERVALHRENPTRYAEMAKSAGVNLSH